MGILLLAANLLARLIGWAVMIVILVVAVFIGAITGGIALIGYVFVSACILLVRWNTRRQLNSQPK